VVLFRSVVSAGNAFVDLTINNIKGDRATNSMTVDPSPDVEPTDTRLTLSVTGHQMVGVVGRDTTRLHATMSGRRR